MKKQIVFVKRNPQIRIFKQALGLARTGEFELVLVSNRFDPDLYRGVFDHYVSYGRRPDRARWQKVFSRIFDHILPYRDETDLAKIIRGLKPYVFHPHAEPNTVPRVVIENARSPVIYDTYDFAGMRHGTEALSPRERAAEQFCLENADGIVNKFSDDVLDYYRGQGYRIRAPVLHYEDYCAEELMVPVASNGTNPEGWHIVYVGVALPASLPPERYAHGQYHNLIRFLARGRNYFHLYPNPYQYKAGGPPCYASLAQELPNFEIHIPVHPRKLSSELRSHHWGAYMAGGPALEEKAAPYAIGNKIASYLEAGLPIVVSGHQDAGRLVTEMGVGVDVKDWSQLQDIHPVLEEHYAKVVKNIESVRKDYSVSNHAHRLVKFYKEIR